MLRDYVRGQYESVDITLEDVGSGTMPLYLDGMIRFAFSDLQIFSDSGYTTPLSPSAYEAVNQDSAITAEELKSGGSSKTIYMDYRILDPTYQTGFIYVRVNNFGAYTNGALVGQDIIQIDSNYSYTTKPGVYKEILLVDVLSADITISVANGGSDIRNIFSIINRDSTYNAIVTDGTDTFYVQPRQSAESCYYDLDSVLINNNHKYDSGWASYSDWTAANFTFTHNLNAFPQDLEIKILLSESGTDTDTTIRDITQTMHPTDHTTFGSFIYGGKAWTYTANSFVFTTGTNGLAIVNNSSGQMSTINTQTRYIKAIVRKRK